MMVVNEYQNTTVPYVYASAGYVITVMAEMKLTAVDIPTGNCYKVTKFLEKLRKHCRHNDIA